MSEWTYVKGSMRLLGVAFEYAEPWPKEPDKASDGTPELEAEWDAYREAVAKARASAYLPYPKEQFVLSPPKAYENKYFDFEEKKWKRRPNEVDAGIEYDCYVLSLPRLRPIIEEAFDEFPEGESYVIRHSLSQTVSDYSGGTNSVCNEDTMLRYYREAVKERHSLGEDPDRVAREDADCLFSWGSVKAEPSFYTNVEAVLVGIYDDVRDCDADDMLNGLQGFIRKIEGAGIIIQGGYLEWQDSDREHIHAWRHDWGVEDGAHLFMTLDAKTNAIVHVTKWVKANDSMRHPKYEVVEEDYGTAS